MFLSFWGGLDPFRSDVNYGFLPPKWMDTPNLGYNLVTMTLKLRTLSNARKLSLTLLIFLSFVLSLRRLFAPISLKVKNLCRKPQAPGSLPGQSTFLFVCFCRVLGATQREPTWWSLGSGLPVEGPWRPALESIVPPKAFSHWGRMALSAAFLLRSSSASPL